MMNVHILTSTELAYRLGWTLVHSLWQGAAVAAGLVIVLAFLRNRSPQARYLALMTALGAMVLCSAITFMRLNVSPSGTAVGEDTPFLFDSPRFSTVPAASPTSAAVRSSAPADQSAPPRAEAPVNWRVKADHWTELALPWVVRAWAAGVLILGIWRVGGWLAVQRLRVLKVRPVDDQVALTVQRLARQLKLTRPVRVVQSLLAETPMVIGWLRPIILLPASVLTSLTPAQLEAILAHELAHIRRHDYLMNLVQVFAETLLFYHPAIWWISRRLRLEREQCCDDVAVAFCQDRCSYAESLAMLEEVRMSHSVALAASGSEGSELLARIRRILGVDHDVRSRGLGGALAFFVIGILCGVLYSCRETPPATTAMPTTQLTGASQSDLLATLQTMRQQIFAAESSGDGVASGAGLYATYIWADSLPDIGAQVRFRFADHSSLAKVFYPFNTGAPLFSILISGRKQFRYVAPPRPNPALMVDEAPVRATDVFPTPEFWSIERLSLPPTFKDDAAFFRILKAPPKDVQVTVHRSGSGVNVELVEVMHDRMGKLENHITYRFDLALGGMLTFYEWTRDRTGPNDYRASTASRLEMNWKREGSMVVPVDRRVRLSQSINGKAKKEPQSTVHFSQFKIEPQKPSDLTVSALNVPEGTLVADTTTGTSGRYFEGYFSHEASAPASKPSSRLASQPSASASLKSAAGTVAERHKIDLSTPKAAAEAFCLALERNDTEAAEQASTGGAPQVIEAVAKGISALQRLADAAVARFGNEGKQLADNVGVNVAEKIDHAQVTESGDSARLRYDSGKGIPLKKVAGQWKVDLAEEKKDDVQRYEKVAKVADEIVAGINSGKYKTAREAQQAFEGRRSMKTPAAQAAPWQGYPRLSPFQAVRWMRRTPQVKVDGSWYELVAVNGIPVDQIVSFAASMGETTWQKHFEEDLVELLTRMGHKPGNTATLSVKDLSSGKMETLKDVPMTEENREALWRAGQRAGAAIGSTSRPSNPAGN